MILRGGLVAEVGAAFGRVLQGGSLSVAAFWAGAAHPRRQKHREMPPPGASAPAFAATVEPASSPQHTKHPSQDASSTRDGLVLGDLLLPASIRDFKSRLENRCKDFLVSGLLRALILKFKPRLENRCKLFPVYTLFRALILDFKPKLENRCKDFLVSGLLRALILKFKPRLENRCKDFPIYTLLRAVILDLMGSIWESLQGFAYRISSLNDVRVRF